MNKDEEIKEALIEILNNCKDVHLNGMDYRTFIFHAIIDNKIKQFSLYAFSYGSIKNKKDLIDELYNNHYSKFLKKEYKNGNSRS